MMEYPLTLKNLLERNRLLFSKKEVFSRLLARDFRYTYGDYQKRVRRLANVLKELGVAPGDRVGTLAWNHHRHLELYFAIPCSGAVMHTLNLRLFPEQLSYVINHAEDKVIFADPDLLPLLERIAPDLKTVRHFVVMADEGEQLPETRLSPVHSYEELLSRAPEEYDFPDLDEWSPAAMCYTTATTGNPKGVVYTHRGLFLHSLACAAADMMGIREEDVVMPVVPMFHANAWGSPFVAVWMGSKLVLPGRRLDPGSLAGLIEQERVTITLGVPTIWLGLLQLLEGGAKYDLSSLCFLLVGGSAAPEGMIRSFREKYGLYVQHAYGMTETTPLATLTRIKSYLKDAPADRFYRVAAKQGVIAPGLEMKVVDEAGREVPWDGKTMGELCLRGPWIAKEYYREPERSAEAIRDGWLHTGDIVTVDEEGYIFIMDRSKDLVKSGGEWISSVDLENTIMAHPAVAEATVIGIPHEKWQERPLACVVLKEAYKGKVSKEDILDFLRDKVVRWWIPDDVVFLEAIPKTSVGKFNKKQLRQMYAEGKLATG
ncbi:MAG: long-chain fatty acid--CoA ligase [Armatimonadetes bacterium]|nr:long-chain fatty acid--CoA ligase [Armatimonadota bacterium]